MATVYDDHTVDGEFSRVSWHPALPLLAAVDEQRSVQILTASSVDKAGVVEASAAGTQSLRSVVAWHPHKAVLAVCWASGTVGTWCESEKLPHLVDEHKAPVTNMCWNTSGTRLLTADESGRVCVWKCDGGKGRIHSPVVHQLSLQGAQAKPTHALTVSGAADTAPLSAPSRFIVATSSGTIHFIDDMQLCVECVNTNSRLAAVLLNENASTLMTITEDLLVSQYTIIETTLVLDRQAKLSFATRPDANAIHALSLGNGVIALSFGGPSIRLIDFVNDENDELTMEDTEAIRFNCIAYDPASRTIAGGTDSGHIILWQMSKSNDAKGNPERTWKSLPRINVGGGIEAIGWDSTGKNIYARKRTALKIISEQATAQHMLGEMAALQVASDRVSVCRTNGTTQIYKDISAGIKVKGVFVNELHVLVWNGAEAECHELDKDLQSHTLVGKFLAAGTLLAMDSKQNVYQVIDQRVDVCNLEGVVKQTLTLNFGARVQCVHMSRGYFTAASTSGEVAVFDISRREAKSHFASGSPLGTSAELGVVDMLVTNTSGELVAFLGRDGPRANHVFAHDLQKKIGFSFDLGALHKKPKAVYWDETDPRLLIVEATAEDAVTYLSFFVTADHGIRLHQQSSKPTANSIICSSVPFVYRVQKPNADGLSWLLPELQRDFVGVDVLDRTTISSLLNFGFYLATENLDAAFKTVSNITSGSIWENLAKMCVKSRRLDVAFTCLGNMGNVRALQSLRRVASKSVEQKLALLAIQLGMPDEAEQIYVERQMYGELARFYEVQGRWEQAIEVVEKHDRMGLKSVYHRYALCLEEQMAYERAMEMFEKAGTASFDVPRMLLKADSKMLADYVNNSSEKAIKKWWGQYAESQGAGQPALEAYESANDALSMVRILCSMGDIERAKQLATTSAVGGHAACFHLARYYENEQNFPEALSWYGQAKCFGHAVRLAKENQMDTELMQLALQGSKNLMLSVAKYYDDQQCYDKAASLYYKGGNSGKAIDLCLRNKQYHMIDIITADLRPETTSPDVLKRCSDLYMERGDFAKAMNMLVKGRQVDHALRLCAEKNVQLSEELVEQMVPEGDTSMASELRSQLLMRLGDICQQQGSYHLACKKYTQAGDRLKAMTALLRSGDSQKIIFFAGVSGAKNKEIYVMAANYLQTINWHESPELIKSIVSFYTKAKAFEPLVRFYEAWAQMEVDDFSDYEKALGAIKDATKALAKSDDPNRESKMQHLTRRIALMEQFVRARQLATVDVGQMFQICRELLSQPKVDESVRVGDIYGCMVESYYANRDMERCVALLVEMRGAVPAGNVEFYLDEKLVQVIRQSARGNIGVTPLATTRRGADVEVPPLPFGEDEIVEDIRGHHD